MLENLIGDVKVVLSKAAFAGAFGLYACAPSLAVPPAFPSHLACCESLSCVERGYDGCREEGIGDEGIGECSCYYDPYDPSRNNSSHDAWGRPSRHNWRYRSGVCNERNPNGDYR